MYIKSKLNNTLEPITGALSFLLGMIVIIGWLINNPTLIQVLPSFVPMQFNTALGFLLIGMSMVFIYQSKIKTAKILSSVAGLIGFLTLFQYITKTNIGLDELFMKHDIQVGTSHPGRMAPNTAICFLISALSINFISNNIKKLELSSLLSSLTFGLGLVALVGYLIGMESTYGWGQLTRMAVHTSIGFMIVGAGLTMMNFELERKYFRQNNSSKKPWLIGYFGALTLTIFFIDLSLPSVYSAGIPYIFVILIAWYSPFKRIIIYSAFITTVLIIIGYLNSNHYHFHGIHLTNRIFAIIALWVVALILQNLKNKTIQMEAINVELDKKVELLEEQNKELEQFSYITSHDLQEPLRTLNSYSDLFLKKYDNELDGDGKKFLKFISQAATRMTVLVKGLLDYSRIGRKHEFKQVDCNKIMHDLLQDVSKLIRDNNVQIQVPELPTIIGNPVEIRLLFQNIITNAIKFRKANINPKITISYTQTKDYWIFSIKDNGIGMAKEFQHKIFDIFQRLHSRSDYEGTGIGLSHCKKIIQSHKGEIWVESELEKGSNFFFKLPKKLELLSISSIDLGEPSNIF